MGKNVTYFCDFCREEKKAKELKEVKDYINDKKHDICTICSDRILSLVLMGGGGTIVVCPNCPICRGQGIVEEDDPMGGDAFRNSTKTVICKTCDLSEQIRRG